MTLASVQADNPAGSIEIMGYVVSEHAVPGRTAPGDTAEVRVAIDASSGCERLEQRVIRFQAGRSADRRLNGRQEVLYVAAGRGTVEVNGERHALEPDTGVYLASGDLYAIENPGPGELHVVSVTAPAEESHAGDRGVTVCFADRPALPASPNREFRYLVNQDLGCHDVTQFVGLIPPGRAAMHSHIYDEVVYVVEGEGVLHLGGASRVRGQTPAMSPRVAAGVDRSGGQSLRQVAAGHRSHDHATRPVSPNQHRGSSDRSAA